MAFGHYISIAVFGTSLITADRKTCVRFVLYASIAGWWYSVMNDACWWCRFSEFIESQAYPLGGRSVPPATLPHSRLPYRCTLGSPGCMISRCGSIVRINYMSSEWWGKLTEHVIQRTFDVYVTSGSIASTTQHLSIPLLQIPCATKQIYTK